MKDRIIAYAQSLGFDRVGITSAEPLAREEAFLQEWLQQGSAGEMDYLERDPQKRSRPQELLPGARSVIALAVNYYTETADRAGEPASRRTGGGVSNDADTPDRRLAGSINDGRIARYAAGLDYHKALGKRLVAFVRYLEAIAPQEQFRTFLDTGPLLERSVAQRAGLGFIGKNTMLITKGFGSWVFLASVITTLDLRADTPDARSCGTCRLCIDACPTDALAEPYRLDARRCISYLTIEHESPIAPELRADMGDWVFGCDICQDVCPHNTRTPVASLAAFQPHGRTPALADILAIASDEEFRERFAGTPIMRAGRRGLVRNACVAAGNLQRMDLAERLQGLAENETDAVIRDAAAWALLAIGRAQECRA